MKLKKYLERKGTQREFEIRARQQKLRHRQPKKMATSNSNKHNPRDDQRQILSNGVPHTRKTGAEWISSRYSEVSPSGGIDCSFCLRRGPLCEVHNMVQKQSPAQLKFGSYRVLLYNKCESAEERSAALKWFLKNYGSSKKDFFALTVFASSKTGDGKPDSVFFAPGRLVKLFGKNVHLFSGIPSCAINGDELRVNVNVRGVYGGVPITR